jgi:Spy/CpxP family protein refolding chaperone
MKRMSGVIAGIGAVLVAASLAYAQGPGFGWGPGYGRGPGWGPGGYGGADLTAEQRTKLDKLRQDHWAALAKLREQMVAKRSEVLAARRAGDTAKADAIAKDLNASYTEQARERDDFHAAMAEVTGVETPAGPGFGPGYGRGWGHGSGPGMGRGFGPGMMMGRGHGMAMGYGTGCPFWQ